MAVYYAKTEKRRNVQKQFFQKNDVRLQLIIVWQRLIDEETKKQLKLSLTNKTYDYEN